jgi:hypothetical protein
MGKKTNAKAPRKNFIMRPKEKMSSITLGELDRAMTAFLESMKTHPGMEAKAVFAALKSFEQSRGLDDKIASAAMKRFLQERESLNLKGAR